MKLRNPFGRDGRERLQASPKDVWEPTTQEAELLARFGGGDRTLFGDVQKAIADAGVEVDRGRKLWDAIRDSRVRHSVPGGSERAS